MSWGTTGRVDNTPFDNVKHGKWNHLIVHLGLSHSTISPPFHLFQRHQLPSSASSVFFTNIYSAVGGQFTSQFRQSTKGKKLFAFVSDRIECCSRHSVCKLAACDTTTSQYEYSVMYICNSHCR